MNKKIIFAKKIWDLHNGFNILDTTILGHSLFWQLLCAPALDPYNLTIKSLNCDVLATASALRKALRKLEKSGWIHTLTHPDDSRLRCVHTTEKFKALASEYNKELDTHFEEFLTTNTQLTVER